MGLFMPHKELHYKQKQLIDLRAGAGIDRAGVGMLSDTPLSAMGQGGLDREGMEGPERHRESASWLQGRAGPPLWPTPHAPVKDGSPHQWYQR